MKQKNTWLISPQPRLGVVGCVVFLSFAIILNALSFDMYTPALPTMVKYFHSTDQLINLTLVSFFALNTIALLIAGPISDKMGRKPVVAVGAALYVTGSIICALSISVPMLVIGRIIQASGSGTIAAIGTAITKDIFVPEKRELALSIVQTTFVVGPVLAPIIGSLILKFFMWRQIFWCLLICGVLVLAMSLLLVEPLPKEQRTSETLMQNMGHLWAISKSKPFIMFLLVVAPFNFAFSAYVAVGSHIFVEFFGTTTFGYSLFFALNAIICSVGPTFYLLVSKKLSPKQFTTFILVFALVLGVGMLLVGQAGPWVFIGLFSIYSMLQGSSRPYSTNILLAQRSTDVGAASSVINFVHSIMGCLGMIFIVAPFPNYIFGVGCFMIGGMIFALILWVLLCRSREPLKGLTD